MTRRQDTGEQTIRDFGEQWLAFPENRGYYGSPAIFEDFLAGLVTPSDLSGKRVADIGSGTGRIVAMLLQAGAAHVTAVEPSASFAVLQRQFASRPDRVTCIHGTGDQLPAEPPLDYVFSFGVLHHIPDPLPVVRAALAALRPGGRIVAWVYGRENNGLYLAVARPLRALARRLPHGLLRALCMGLWVPLRLYGAACRRLRLPMRDYLVNVYSRLRFQDQVLVIYDQLNPAYAKYYRQQEAQDLLDRGGFVNIRLSHRHGYGWTMVGQRPGGT